MGRGNNAKRAIDRSAHENRTEVPPSRIQHHSSATCVASASNCSMSIRRRNNPASATSTSSDASNWQDQDTQPVQPIDESEQNKIVKNLRANTIKITNELCNVVVLACMGAGALTVIFPMLIAYTDSSANDRPNERNNHHSSPPSLSHLLYTITSCLSHCLMAHIAHVSKFPLRWNPSYPVRSATTHSGLYASAVASVVFQGLCVGYLNWDSSVDPVTIGQMIGNLCTLIAALFVAMDSTSTEDVLRKHDGSRYGFKSL